MKRANNLLPFIQDMDNLRLAFWKAGKGKRYSTSVLTYRKELDRNLLQLQQQIIDAKVKVGDYRYFLIYEPKRREICASAFSEQVLHHALMNVCHPYFDRRQIYDSYASRKGKGTYAALERAKVYTRKYKWFLKMDVKKFFASIHHDVLKKQLSGLFKEQHLLLLLYQIIDSFSVDNNRGLPIGNLTSQYFANHYLSGLDHYIKEDLRIKAYVRYMDDMVLWSNDKTSLLQVKPVIEDYTNRELKLSLNESILNRSSKGLPFLGYRIMPYQVRLLQKSKLRFIRKMTYIHKQLYSGNWNEAIACAHALPLMAYINHRTTNNFQKNIMFYLQG